jgi:hypothetical protein
MSHYSFAILRQRSIRQHKPSTIVAACTALYLRLSVVQGLNHPAQASRHWRSRPCALLAAAARQFAVATGGGIDQLKRGSFEQRRDSLNLRTCMHLQLSGPAEHVVPVHLTHGERAVGLEKAAGTDTGDCYLIRCATGWRCLAVSAR